MPEAHPMQQETRYISPCLRWLTVITLCATVNSIPWILGGVVPVASMVLLCGSLVAASFSLLYQLSLKKSGIDLPKIIVPLLGLAIIGFWQLSPASTLPATGIDAQFSQFSLPPANPSAYTHTLSPSDTRTRIANYLSLALVSLAAFQTLRTGSVISFAALTVIANGIAMGLVGMTLMFENSMFSWNTIWELGWYHSSGSRGFASFINPNSAGGWLCLTMAVTVGWVHWHLKKTAAAPKLRRGRLRISWIGRTWQQALEVLADLTVWQILSLAAVAFLAAAAAATKSRGAMGALTGAILLTVAVKSSIRVLPFALAFVMLGGGLTYAFLDSLDLSNDVTSELETLQSYESAVGSRPEHWWDALHAFADFPLLGTGIGSYRFAILPYGTSYHQVWFRNADNQYIETLVESGLVGLILFVSIGLIGFQVGKAATQHAKVRRHQKDGETEKLSRRILAGFGTAVTFAVLSQAVAASVDYGIAMPPASSLLILLIAAASGYLNAGPEDEPTRTAGAFRCSKIVAAILTILTIVAAGGFLKDQWHATEIDRHVVKGHRLLIEPIQAGKLDQLQLVAEDLKQSLANRPDDAEGLQLLCRLKTTQFRWQTLLNAAGPDIRTASGLSNQWRDWTLFRLVGSLYQIQQDSPEEGEKLRQQLTKLAAEVGLPETLNSAQQRLPHLPAPALVQAAYAAIVNDSKLFLDQVQRASIIDPADAELQFELGLLALRMQEPELASQCWARSLELSNRFRPAILEDAIQFYFPEEALTKFGPDTYRLCTESASGARNPILREQLWKRAEELWRQVPTPVSETDSVQRLRHLKKTGRSSQIMPWITTILDQHPDNVELRSEYANQLEQNGKYLDALNQWQRIQFHHPDNQAASKNIRRLNELK